MPLAKCRSFGRLTPIARSATGAPIHPSDEDLSPGTPRSVPNLRMTSQG